jgi:hypothetical protein
MYVNSRQNLRLHTANLQKQSFQLFIDKNVAFFILNLLYINTYYEEVTVNVFSRAAELSTRDDGLKFK